MKATALLGGPKEEWPDDLVSQLQAADIVLGVDRGALLLQELGIIPDVAIGDFDSLKKKELQQLETLVPDIRYSNPVKDLTDSELMLQIAFEDYQIDELNIFGATGGRIDHFLVNLLMILNPQINLFASRIRIIDKQNYIRFYCPGSFEISKIKQYPYFGVMTLTEIQNLNISGARYDLANYNGKYPRVFSSNEFLPNKDNFNLSFKNGTVAVILSKDIDRFYNI
ncbi:thiamine diphosphokinase [Lactobacillus sp. LL6]|uniref:thiamine diphosphokinase n=1 Tax=Lactobacillus sp. LL6 TaxID=2596827 RepID=UPI00118654E5|nr:thiamine diphosphokinase [Lactobacillus sp. LL6]TSO26508.1 thiamine diphosphokinase [Lactobacillus sp. LL6]